MTIVFDISPRPVKLVAGGGIMAKWILVLSLFYNLAWAKECDLLQGRWKFKTFSMEFHFKDCKEVRVSTLANHKKVSSEFEVDINNEFELIQIKDYDESGRPEIREALARAHFDGSKLSIQLNPRNDAVQYNILYEPEANALVQTVEYKDEGGRTITKSMGAFRIRGRHP